MDPARNRLINGRSSPDERLIEMHADTTYEIYETSVVGALGGRIYLREQTASGVAGQRQLIYVSGQENSRAVLLGPPHYDLDSTLAYINDIMVHFGMTAKDGIVCVHGNPVYVDDTSLPYETRFHHYMRWQHNALMADREGQLEIQKLDESAEDMTDYVAFTRVIAAAAGGSHFALYALYLHGQPADIPRPEDWPYCT